MGTRRKEGEKGGFDRRVKGGPNLEAGAIAHEGSRTRDGSVALMTRWSGRGSGEGKEKSLGCTMLTRGSRSRGEREEHN